VSSASGFSDIVPIFSLLPHVAENFRDQFLHRPLRSSYQARIDGLLREVFPYFYRNCCRKVTTDFVTQNSFSGPDAVLPYPKRAKCTVGFSLAPHETFWVVLFTWFVFRNRWSRERAVSYEIRKRQGMLSVVCGLFI